MAIVIVAVGVYTGMFRQIQSPITEAASDEIYAQETIPFDDIGSRPKRLYFKRGLPPKSMTRDSSGNELFRPRSGRLTIGDVGSESTIDGLEGLRDAMGNLIPESVGTKKTAEKDFGYTIEEISPSAQVIAADWGYFTRFFDPKKSKAPKTYTAKTPSGTRPKVTDMFPEPKKNFLADFSLVKLLVEGNSFTRSFFQTENFSCPGCGI